MKQSITPLIVLTVGCTLAAAIFGFGSEVFAFKSSYGNLGREPLILLTRLVVYIVLAVTLVFRGGWTGVVAALIMTVCATLIEWALFPFAYQWAAVSDPSGYQETFGGVTRPTYGAWALSDILGVGIAAALTQGLRIMANVNPNQTPDE